MNKKYERYIDYIVNDIQPPYFINMRDQYGLRPDEYELVLSKVFNQGKLIFYEDSKGFYDNQGNLIYIENSDGDWSKYEYNTQGKLIYYENSDGFWEKREYDDQGNLIYFENSNGYIEDNR